MGWQRRLCILADLSFNGYSSCPIHINKCCHVTHSLWKFRQNILTFSYLSEVIFFSFSYCCGARDQTKAHARHEGGLLITNLWLRRQRLQLTAGVIRKSGIFFPRAVPCSLVLCVNAQRNDSPDNCPGFWVYRAGSQNESRADLKAGSWG